MFAISEKNRKIDGIDVTTYTRDIVSCNFLEVEVGTNGYQGGTDIRVKPLGRYGDDGFEVIIGGDCELETMITALKFITQALEDGAKEANE